MTGFDESRTIKSVNLLCGHSFFLYFALVLMYSLGSFNKPKILHFSIKLVNLYALKTPRKTESTVELCDICLRRLLVHRKLFQVVHIQIYTFSKMNTPIKNLTELTA